MNTEFGPVVDLENVVVCNFAEHIKCQSVPDDSFSLLFGDSRIYSCSEHSTPARLNYSLSEWWSRCDLTFSVERFNSREQPPFSRLKYIQSRRFSGIQQFNTETHLFTLANFSGSFRFGDSDPRSLVSARSFDAGIEAPLRFFDGGFHSRSEAFIGGYDPVRLRPAAMHFCKLKSQQEDGSAGGKSQEKSEKSYPFCRGCSDPRRLVGGSFLLLLGYALLSFAFYVADAPYGAHSFGSRLLYWSIGGVSFVCICQGANLIFELM
jgi:hypothetical protein